MNLVVGTKKMDNLNGAVTKCASVKRNLFTCTQSSIIQSIFCLPLSCFTLHLTAKHKTFEIDY